MPSAFEMASSSRKRAKLSNGKEVASDDIETIPSSQSDEQELCLPKVEPRKSLETVKESVLAWQKASQQSTSTSPTPQWDHSTRDVDFDIPMDIDTPAFSSRPSTPTNPPSFESLPTSTQFPVPNESSIDHRTPSIAPPELHLASSSASSSTKVDRLLSTTSNKVDDHSSPAPGPTTSPLTSEDKTAKLIAEIKRKAMATVSAPDEVEKQYDEPLPDLDDSSDEDDGLNFQGKKRYVDRVQDVNMSTHFYQVISAFDSS